MHHQCRHINSTYTATKPTHTHTLIEIKQRQYPKSWCVVRRNNTAHKPQLVEVVLSGCTSRTDIYHFARFSLANSSRTRINSAAIITERRHLNSLFSSFWLRFENALRYFNCILQGCLFSSDLITLFFCRTHLFFDIQCVQYYSVIHTK